ncbi:MAG: DUF1957 domain-containing protein [Bacteroides sp.]|nr:DUF1957 domain-containing protein [Prevotella sp.]MCM1407313.1 DUF1957 domain-containing protein [Treponema brennaborense]MCM1469803.1 DUF1957 domain-containing protein [Bacteroides sp.]
MNKKSLAIVIYAQQGYFRHIYADSQQYSCKHNQLFTAITYTYLPLLNMFANLEADGIPFKIGLVLPPVLCSLLDDPVMQQCYIEWLDTLIKLGESEAALYADDDPRRKLACLYLKQLQYAKRDYTETLGQNILSKFAYYAKRGNIEMIATTATDCFLPHILDMPEAVSAQIETGLQSHKFYFDVLPEGFWLPDLGYTPGLEKAVRSYGLNYTILDSASVLFAHPTPDLGIFSPVRCENSLAVFARDNETTNDSDIPVYNSNPVYRNQNRDIGYEADSDYLNTILQNNCRNATGFCYYANNKNSVYDPDKAQPQIVSDAENFLESKIKKLEAAAAFKPDADLSLVCTFSAETFGGKWHEGILWLEQIFRQAADKTDIDLVHCTDLTHNQFSLQRVNPFNGASSGTGYGENLLDSSNGWMMRYIHKSTERMIDLAARFSDDTGLKARSLNLAAKEVLLAQSSIWAKMIHEKTDPEYATDCFSKSITAFSTVFESLGSNNISTEWLTRIEREHPIFNWINYHVFATKK